MNPEISQLSGFPNIPGIMNILVGDDKANEEVLKQWIEFFCVSVINYDNIHRTIAGMK